MGNIEDVLGTEITEKLKAANKRQRKFQFNDLTKKELLLGLKENFAKALDAYNELKYVWTVGSNSYDVVLLKTPEELNLSTGVGKGGTTWCRTKLKYGVDFRKYCGAFLTEDQFKTLVTDQEYVCVGYMKVGEWNNKPNYTFNVHELIALAEVNNELSRIRESGL